MFADVHVDPTDHGEITGHFNDHDGCLPEQPYKIHNCNHTPRLRHIFIPTRTGLPGSSQVCFALKSPRRLNKSNVLRTKIILRPVTLSDLILAV
ncbi:hypothetical protein QN277_012858 [Acacia crassicarpa]|uniref:Uncharacterized protein n=1 Tax=Acacia crassicarpa TaxID=499986 RepID=A0AAE1N1Y3_9FABA|nr:hypothetical protein QN277_012858 [Acacia crassicarpa]